MCLVHTHQWSPLAPRAVETTCCISYGISMIASSTPLQLNIADKYSADEG